MKKIIIDCDPGMDDSMALIMALKSPLLKVLAITTVNGNYPVNITCKNALKILELLNITDIPVSRGQNAPLIRKAPPDPFTHGKDGQGENNLPEPKLFHSEKSAVDIIISTVMDNPHEVTILSLAPMTNLALAILKEPSIVPLIPEIIAISGAFGLNKSAFINATGDSPQSEWNVFVDPEAADIVYKSGIPLTAIGLDVATHFCVDFSEDDITAFGTSTRKEASFLYQAIQFVRKRGFNSYCTVIDCMAVAYAIDKNLIKTFPVHVGVETKGELTLGMTVIDRRHHHTWEHLPIIQVAYDADYQKFLDMVKEAVLS